LLPWLAMSQSLSSVHLHAVFSTKNREPFLADTGLRVEAHAYLAEVTKRLDCPAIVVGGVEDHVHLLVRFSRTITIADWLRETKRVSSGFLKQRDSSFAWQSGYGAFAVEVGRLEVVSSYIMRQEEHHERVSFQDEFRLILSEHGIEWDEQFVWK
jgi:putative transposase